MSSLVKELLSRASDQDDIGWTPTTVIPVPARLLHHAADRIEQLEAALREISDCKTFTDRKYMIDLARAALEERT